MFHVSQIKELYAGFCSGKLNGPHGRPKHKWEENINMDLKEIGCGLDEISLAEDRTGCRLIYFMRTERHYESNSRFLQLCQRV
jgi:hypothetical protein